MHCVSPSFSLPWIDPASCVCARNWRDRPRVNRWSNVSSAHSRRLKRLCCMFRNQFRVNARRIRNRIVPRFHGNGAEDFFIDRTLKTPVVYWNMKVTIAAVLLVTILCSVRESQERALTGYMSQVRDASVLREQEPQMDPFKGHSAFVEVLVKAVNDHT